MIVLATTTTFALTITGFCMSPSEARIGIPVSNIHRRQLEAEGVTPSDWTQIGGNVQAGTNYYEELGFRVDISGDGSTLAIGSPLVNDTQGQVMVSRLNLTTDEWEPMGSDIAGDEEYGAAGLSVSLSQDGTILAVGFPSFTYTPYQCCKSSSVRVYTWNQDIDDWEQLGSNIFDIKIFHDEYPEYLYPQYFLSNLAGWAVSLSDDGTTVAVGAPSYFLNGTGYVGQVRVYHFDSEVSNEWKQLGQSITGNEKGGFSVSLSGDGSTLALGDPDATVGINATVNGSVQVFAINETRGWEPIGNVILGDEEGGQTGYSVSLSKNGTNLAVGHPNHGKIFASGLVRVYQINQTTSNWDQVGPDIVPDTELEWEDGQGFGDGRSVSLSGDGQTVAVAAPSQTVNGVALGLGRVFRLNAITAKWDKIGRTIPGEVVSERGSRYDLVSLSSDGSRLVVGAPMNQICSYYYSFSCAPPRDLANWTGHVRVFDLTEGSSAPSTTTIVPISAPPTAPAPTFADSAPITTPKSTTAPTIPPTNPDSGGTNASRTRRLMHLLLLSASLVLVL